MGYIKKAQDEVGNQWALKFSLKAQNEAYPNSEKL
jgi:hypothetical protein